MIFTKSLLQSHDSTEKTVIDPDNHEPRRKEFISEASAQSDIVNYLAMERTKGNLFYQRVNTTGTFDPKTKTYRSLAPGVHAGFPDIVVIKNGRMIFLEVKSNSGSQSSEQKEIEKELIAQGAEYYIVRTLNFVERILNRE